MYRPTYYPELGETFYYIIPTNRNRNFELNEFIIEHEKWYGDIDNMALYYTGNVFRSNEEATRAVPKFLRAMDLARQYLEMDTQYITHRPLGQIVRNLRNHTALIDKNQYLIDKVIDLTEENQKLRDKLEGTMAAIQEMKKNEKDK